MAGITFILHGLPKFENLQGTQGFFASVGIPADLADTNRTTRSNRRSIIDSRTIARITSILFTIEMICAVLIVKADNGFMGQGGFEVDLLLMSISISLLLSGPGRISIERDVLKREIFPKASYKKNSISDTK